MCEMNLEAPLYIIVRWQHQSTCFISAIRVIRLGTFSQCPPYTLMSLQILESTPSHTRTKKVSDALHQIGQGLVDNDGLEDDALLTFVYALTKEVLPGLRASV